MLPYVSLLAIVIAVVIGFWRDINVGLIALVFSLLVGYFWAGIPITDIINFWPMKLFFTTVGITLLFSIAKLNGTLEKISRVIIAQSKGKKVLIPIIFYFLALAIASVGPGNISTSALLLPIGLVIAYRTNISVLMVSTLIITGSIAGGLSPLAPNGIVALDLAANNGVGDLGYQIYLMNVISMTLFSAIVFFACGGLKLVGERVEIEEAGKFTVHQIITLISILLLVIWVILTGINVGFAAIVFSVFLLTIGAADQDKAILNIPWSTLLLICGTAVLISVVSEVGGVKLLSDFLSMLSNEYTAVPIMSILAGVMSIFSSAVGVVMPTLIPTTAAMSAELGTVSAAMLTVSVAVASHIVTMSPFSTMGALALASSPKSVDKKALFRDLFIVAFCALAFIAIFLGIVASLGYLA